jgi:hypothetical protein
MWVRDDERLDSPHNVWLHEYVHARQAYTAERDAYWFTEATASYYAALLTLQQGRIGFDSFRARLALGARSPDASAELADPATWIPTVPYTKGALVAGELDRRIRLATDRTRSMQAVFRRVNAREGTVSGDALTGSVRAVGGDDVAALSVRYTTTADVPPTWNRSAHERAFGPTPARIEYALPPSGSADGVRVSGPYRNGSVGAARPIRLATGETLAVDVRVTNVGGTTGTYDARLVVENRSTATQSGELGPNESTTLTFSHRFTSPGEYALTVGGDRVAVEVSPPATPTVSGLDATTVGRRDGTGVTVTATASNPSPVPAAGTLTLRRNGTPVETVRVAVAPGEERTVAFAETVVGPGRHVFRVGDRTVTVAAPPATPLATSTSTRGGGFGAVAALAALLATPFVASGRGRD